MARRTEDRRTAALVEEVERRKKLPGMHNYSYGRLVADTTLEQRNEIAAAYKHGTKKVSCGTFAVPNDKDALQNAMTRAKDMTDEMSG